MQPVVGSGYIILPGAAILKPQYSLLQDSCQINKMEPRLCKMKGGFSGDEKQSSLFGCNTFKVNKQQLRSAGLQLKIHHQCNEKPLSETYSIYHEARFTSVQCIDFVTEETRLTFTKRRHLDAFQC